MEVTHRPHTISLSHRGTITGLTISTKAATARPRTYLCHYYGGIRYALPPPQRWRRARKLPAGYTYGSEDAPGKCDSGAGVCPQPGFMNLSPPNEELWTEDCFQCNVWVPVGEAPRRGWPVMVYFRMFLPYPLACLGLEFMELGWFLGSIDGRVLIYLRWRLAAIRHTEFLQCCCIAWGI